MPKRYLRQPRQRRAGPPRRVPPLPSLSRQTGAWWPSSKLMQHKPTSAKVKNSNGKKQKHALHTHRGARRWFSVARSRDVLTAPDNASLTVLCKPDLAQARPFMVWVMVRLG